MREREGCEVLCRCFKAAGVDIEENVRFVESGVDVSLDGWDPRRRIGYEFITDEAGDRAEFTSDVIDALERRMEAGELYVFLVDETNIADAGRLASAAEAFLAQLRARGVLS